MRAVHGANRDFGLSLTVRINQALSHTEYRLIDAITPRAQQRSWLVCSYSLRHMRQLRGFRTRLAALFYLQDRGTVLPDELMREAVMEGRPRRRRRGAS